MGFGDILNEDRVSVSNEAEGLVRDKAGALRRLSRLLALGQDQVSEGVIYEVLAEREKLQSTGVGEGVAVPHGRVERLEEHVGALLVCPEPIDFDAIDDKPVSILFALIGPKGAAAEHLRVLARMSKLLKHDGFRTKLKATTAGSEAFALIQSGSK